ncbi:unnamed protein product [Adineta steineri]|uniref:Uncharacterized protein n=1 Tax=Adineta steineri TaxID=433720 RepID=A0A819K4N8_9BILA|nr:unnamed protein product [Adineta steineri]CAF3939855.1 unnamed protein product [Adineta steineri]
MTIAMDTSTYRIKYNPDVHTTTFPSSRCNVSDYYSQPHCRHHCQKYGYTSGYCMEFENTMRCKCSP